MFKQTEESNSLARLMHLELHGSGIDKIAHAVECMSKAADIFDNIGLRSEAAYIRSHLTNIIGE